LTKKAFDLGDQEIIAGGTNRGPRQWRLLEFSEILPSAAMFSIDCPFGDESAKGQSATTLRIVSFHAAEPEVLQLCAKLKLQNPAHSRGKRRVRITVLWDM
jgi:hypothetical protein